jgi:hypothetical protein
MSRVAFFLGIFFALGGVGVVSFSVLHVHAQDATAMADPLTLDVQPANPAPYGTLTITPSSTVYDIQSSTISVTLNGKSFYKGTGGTAVSIPVTGPGTTMTIGVKIVSVNGQVTSKTITIKPASVALVVEPVSTTHPFYQGAGLVTSNAPIRVVAIPDLRLTPTKPISADSLVYTWKFGDQVLEQDSGIGKSVLSAVAPPRYRDADLSVTVATQDGSIVAEGNTTVSAVEPITLIYGNDPLLGPLYDNVLPSAVTMSDAESTYRGVAYYYSEAPAITWTVNGEQSGSAQDLTVRASGNGAGSAVVAFQADQNDTSITANSTVAVTFGSAKSGFFGL